MMNSCHIDDVCAYKWFKYSNLPFMHIKRLYYHIYRYLAYSKYQSSKQTTLTNKHLAGQLNLLRIRFDLFKS